MSPRLRRARNQTASCREAMRMLQFYLDGQTDDHTAGRVARHLAACRRCGLEAATYREIKAVLSRRARRADVSTLERLRVFGRSLVEPDASEGGPGPVGHQR